MSECRIDASAYAKRLGFKHPVHFVISPIYADDTYERGISFESAARTSWQPDGTHLIEVLPGEVNSLVTDPSERAKSFAEIIAHELWHAKQAEDSGMSPMTWTLNTMASNVAYDWEHNPYEVDAVKHQRDFLQDIKVIGDCEEWGAPAKLEELETTALDDVMFAALRTHTSSWFAMMIHALSNISVIRAPSE